MTDTDNGLLNNIERLHTTVMGKDRITRNLGLDAADPVAWCKGFILDPRCVITRKGKNWYARREGITITVNAHSYTVITASSSSPR